MSVHFERIVQLTSDDSKKALNDIAHKLKQSDSLDSRALILEYLERFDEISPNYSPDEWRRFMNNLRLLAHLIVTFKRDLKGSMIKEKQVVIDHSLQLQYLQLLQSGKCLLNYKLSYYFQIELSDEKYSEVYFGVVERLFDAGLSGDVASLINKYGFIGGVTIDTFVSLENVDLNVLGQLIQSNDDLKLKLLATVEQKCTDCIQKIIESPQFSEPLSYFNSIESIKILSVFCNRFRFKMNKSDLKKLKFSSIEFGISCASLFHIFEELEVLIDNKALIQNEFLQAIFSEKTCLFIRAFGNFRKTHFALLKRITIEKLSSWDECKEMSSKLDKTLKYRGNYQSYNGIKIIKKFNLLYDPKCKIIMVNTVESLGLLHNELLEMREAIIAIDCEWLAKMFCKSRTDGLDLLQLGIQTPTKRICYLIDTMVLDLNQLAKTLDILFENEDFTKIGFATVNDIIKIQQSIPLSVKNLKIKDLSKHFKPKYGAISLGKLAENELGVDISAYKLAGLFDWKKRPLSKLMTAYAGKFKLIQLLM